MLKSALENVAPLLPLVIGQAVGANEIGTWLLTAAAVAVIAHQLMGVVEKVRKLTAEKPPPAETYATLVSCDLKHRDLDRQFAQHQHALDDLQKQVRIDLKSIHDRINTVAERMGEIVGEMKARS